MASIITLKDLSPQKRCKYGHYYPKEYDKDCMYCKELKELENGNI